MADDTNQLVRTMMSNAILMMDAEREEAVNEPIRLKDAELENAVSAAKRLQAKEFKRLQHEWSTKANSAKGGASRVQHVFRVRGSLVPVLVSGEPPPNASSGSEVLSVD